VNVQVDAVSYFCERQNKGRYLYESSQKMTYDLIFTFTKIAYSVDLNVHQNDLPPLF
jgi:hypothetical protein